jgi:hypothetical protein
VSEAGLGGGLGVLTRRAPAGHRSASGLNVSPEPVPRSSALQLPAMALCASVWSLPQSRDPRDPLLTSRPGRHGEHGSTPASAGFFRPPRAEFAENCGHVRPASSIVATAERQKPWICRLFSKPSDGLEPSTPSLP